MSDPKSPKRRSGDELALVLRSFGHTGPTDIVGTYERATKSVVGNLDEYQRRLRDLCLPWLRERNLIPLIQNLAAAAYTDARLYRETHRTMEDFAESIGYKRETFLRQAQKGRTLFRFLLLGREDLPTGRKLARIASLPVEHQLPAWDFVRQRVPEGAIRDDVGLYLIGLYTADNQPWKTIATTPEALDPNASEDNFLVIDDWKVVAEKAPIPSELKSKFITALAEKDREFIAGCVAEAELADWVFKGIESYPTTEASRSGAGLWEIIEELRFHEPELADRLKRHADALLGLALAKHLKQLARIAKSSTRPKREKSKKRPACIEVSPGSTLQEPADPAVPSQA